jgi:hypothetical protein
MLCNVFVENYCCYINCVVDVYDLQVGVSIHMCRHLMQHVMVGNHNAGCMGDGCFVLSWKGR